MSRKLTLTPSAVDALVEGSINDPLTPGLSLERLPSGKKIWRCSRWVPANRTLLRRSLSAYPAHSITSARAWASELNSQIEAGMDPRDIEREEEKRSGMTVRRAHTLYMEAVEQGRSSRAKRKNRPRTISDTRANGR